MAIDNAWPKAASGRRGLRGPVRKEPQERAFYPYLSCQPTSALVALRCVMLFPLADYDLVFQHVVDFVALCGIDHLDVALTIVLALQVADDYIENKGVGRRLLF